MSYRLRKQTSYKGQKIYHYSTLGVSGRILKGLPFYVVVSKGLRRKFANLSDAKVFIDKK